MWLVSTTADFNPRVAIHAPGSGNRWLATVKRVSAADGWLGCLFLFSSGGRHSLKDSRRREIWRVNDAEASLFMQMRTIRIYIIVDLAADCNAFCAAIQTSTCLQHICSGML
jgi:hypothetical protein